MEIILAITLGTLFGFVLNRVGATNPNYIINMLKLKDMHLAKTILVAIGISSILLFLGMSIGLINPEHLSIKTAEVAVIIGGLIFGIGFAIAGYCPGTGLAAASTGRKDAMIFIVGGLLGAFAYMLSFEYLKDTWLMDKIASGNVMLANIGLEKYHGLIHFIPGTLLAVIFGVILIAIAYKLPIMILFKSEKE